jgi:hypothetical protein
MVTAEKIFGLDRDRSREGQNSALLALIRIKATTIEARILEEIKWEVA